MTTSQFKVGDVVRMRNGRNYISEPITITKQYKNGNLLVDGKQFSVDGWQRGGSSWDSMCLMLDGSDECRKALHKVWRDVAERTVAQSIRRVSDETLRSALQEIKTAQAAEKVQP